MQQRVIVGLLGCPASLAGAAQAYRRLLRELPAYAEAMVTLDGVLGGAKTGGLMLERVRFKVDRRRGGPPKA